MKNLKYILGVSLAALTFASCDNYFDQKLIGNNYKPTDVRTLEYTLTGDDYKTVTSNAKNIEAAKALCTPEDSTAYTAFLQIAKDKAFNETATADMYLPAFIYAKFPQLSMGSMCNVTYNVAEGMPEYLGDFSNARDYTLTEEDYQLAWGSDVDYVKYLTPKTVGKLASILAAAAQEDDNMLVVSYAYQENEPVFGGSGEPAMKTPIADLIAAYDAGTVAENEEVTVSGYIVSMFLKPNNFAKYGSVSVWLNDSVTGTVKQFELYNCYGFDGDTLKSFEPSTYEDGAANMDVTSVSDDKGNTWSVGDHVKAIGKIKLYNGTYELNTGCHFVPVSGAPQRAAMAGNTKKVIYTLNGTWAEYKNEKVTATVLMSEDIAKAEKFLEVNFPYASTDDKVVLVYTEKKEYTAKEFTFDGAAWTENTGLITETLSFALTEEWLANLSVYYKQAIMGEGQGKLVIQDVALAEGITYVWSYAASYGMKGTSYASGAHAAESWVVTPGIKLKNSKQPALNFDQAINYGPDDENRGEEMSVWVSTDYDGDVTTATWTRLPWNTFSDETSIGFPETNSWTFYNSGDMDLSEFNGKTIYIGFRYYAEEGWTCSTWEFKNLLVHEAE